MESLPTTGTIADVAAMARIDELERRMVAIGGEAVPSGNGATAVITPVRHHFTPGLYIREIFMPAGAVVTSKIHRTRHPFVVSRGSCYVYMGGAQWEHISAPHFGVTEPGTRRVLVLLEDTVWLTFHVTDKTDIAEIDKDILIPYENPLLRTEVAA